MPVKITSDGIFKIKWNKVSKTYELDTYVSPNLIFTALREEVIDLDDVTLKTIFQVVDHYPLLKDFISKYCWCRDIDEFHAEVKQVGEPTVKEISFSKEGTVGGFTSFVDVEFNQDVSSTLLSMNIKNAANAPMKLIKTGKIYEINKKGEEVNRISGEVEFTLLDILDAIYWEISFFGGVNETKRFFNQ